VTIPSALSFVVGVCAAVVATIALVWNIRKEKSRIKLRIDASGEFESETETGELITEERMDVLIINDSYKPVTIKRVGINYGSWHDEWHELDDFGCKLLKLKDHLNAGDSQIWSIPMKQIKGRSANYIYVEDGGYHRYKMKIPEYIFEG
jgi:hypothetical protein